MSRDPRGPREPYTCNAVQCDYPTCVVGDKCAYSLGVLHFHVGIPQSANPFNVQLDTRSYDLWEAGWLDEEQALTSCRAIPK